MKTATKTKAIASIELDGFKLETTGIYGESEWETTMSFPTTGLYIPSKTWVDTIWIDDETDLDKFVWEEVLRILQKYNGVSVQSEEVEVEVEDEDE